MIKTKWMSSRRKAEEAFSELKNVLGKGCWLSLDEFVENDEADGFDYGMQVYFEEL